MIENEQRLYNIELMEARLREEQKQDSLRKKLTQLYGNLFYYGGVDEDKCDEIEKEIYIILEELTPDTILEPNDDRKEVKTIVVKYLFHENNASMHEPVKDTRYKSEDIINKEIEIALRVLAQYNTDEYKCLVDNGFIHFYKKKRYIKPEKITWKTFNSQRKQNFIKDLIEVGVSGRHAERIRKALDEI